MDDELVDVDGVPGIEVTGLNVDGKHARLEGEPFTYRGIQCWIVKMSTMASAQWVNGYVTGPFSISGEDEAYDAGVAAHGGVTYTHVDDVSGLVTLGFDTMHAFDSPETQSDHYVAVAIREMVDSLFDLGLVVVDTKGIVR